MNQKLIAEVHEQHKPENQYRFGMRGAFLAVLLCEGEQDYLLKFYYAKEYQYYQIQDSLLLSESKELTIGEFININEKYLFIFLYGRRRKFTYLYQLDTTNKKVSLFFFRQDNPKSQIQIQRGFLLELNEVERTLTIIDINKYPIIQKYIEHDVWNYQIYKYQQMLVLTVKKTQLQYYHLPKLYEIESNTINLLKNKRHRFHLRDATIKHRLFDPLKVITFRQLGIQTSTQENIVRLSPNLYFYRGKVIFSKIGKQKLLRSIRKINFNKFIETGYIYQDKYNKNTEELESYSFIIYDIRQGQYIFFGKERDNLFFKNEFMLQPQGKSIQIFIVN